MSVSINQITLKLRIFDNDTGEEFLLPVAECTLAFAVNSIPTCVAHVALGHDLSTEYLNVPVNRRMRSLMKRYQTCQIIGKITGDIYGIYQWPEETQILFEGRITAISDSLLPDGVAMKVNIMHWLGDLSGVSIIASHANVFDPRLPQNPIGYYTPGSGVTDAQERKLGGIGTLVEATLLSELNIGSDVWGMGIKRIIANILNNPNYAAFNFNLCGEELNLPTEDLKLAVQRIEGPTGKEAASPLSSPYSKWTGPVVFDDGSDYNRKIIAGNIARTLKHQPINAIMRTDAWTMLVEQWLPELHLMLVPKIDSAMVVPSLPVVRQPYCQSISSNDIINIDGNRSVNRTYRGVGLISTMETPTRVIDGQFATQPVCWYPDPKPESGQMLYKTVPSWLNNLLPSAWTIKNMQRGRTVFNGAVKNEDDAAKDDEEATTAVNAILEDYARLTYATHNMGNNTVILTGRLRFDICPGSTVRIDASRRSGSGMLAVNPQIQGLVTHVTVTISAPALKGLTQFQIQHVRTLEENDRDDVTLDNHPLYYKPFYGAPLKDAYMVPRWSGCPE